MLLFVGLGNPTPDSEHNRHNVGFKIIDTINKKFSLSKQKPKFKGLLTTGNIEDEKIKPFVEDLNVHIEILNNFTSWIKEKIQNSKDDASAACNDYLKALGFVSIAHAWLKVLEVSFKDYDSNKGFYEDKIQTAKFYFKRVLPRMENHFKTAATGSEYIMNFNFK